jgi:hypothetical protein
MLDVWNTILSLVAPSTKLAYEKTFFQFVSFFESKGLDFRSLSIESVLCFLQTFVGKSTSRIRSAVAALKMFL